MSETFESSKTVGGIFNYEVNVQDAIYSLEKEGFDESHIGVVAAKNQNYLRLNDYNAMANTPAGNPVIGMGPANYCALRMVVGNIPGIGPAITGGTLAAILSSAAAGAASSGLPAALIGFGFSDADIRYVESQLEMGRTVVTVKFGDRADTAREILDRMCLMDQVEGPYHL